ncbi:MAG: glutamate-5-semialdehyde dehydrogenase [Planctomycetia bacterium]|nr:glutamate-5-semialdehyde dehydrogenase [Planctomycetia bacterium]RLT12784.1 MAG: glutamate-5-semialdehyde dehydrogenase [Planctomycetota bacterium]
MALISGSVVPEALSQHCRQIAMRARQASIDLASMPTEKKVAALKGAAAQIRADVVGILAANRLDVAAAAGFGLSPAEIDRLVLDPKRVEGIAAGVEAVANLPDPVGEVLERSTRPNGLEICKLRVPLGVVFFIYESRPNVTADAAAVAIASGNAIILRGGKEAAHSSARLVVSVRQAIAAAGLPDDCVQLVDTPNRDAVGALLSMDDLIDIVIPRGGETLIRRVCTEARMPVLKHFSGNCHVYVDCAADLAMAKAITINAKCQRMGVCNAAESLLVHRDVAADFLPEIARALGEHSVTIVGDTATQHFIPSAGTATAADFAREFLGPKISIAVVDSLDAAINHINLYGSRHTDSIITADKNAADRFAARVDTAVVMVNASTRFNDGGEMGLGAEIGISTDKLHARGPCGTRELTTYKYIVVGTGQTRG